MMVYVVTKKDPLVQTKHPGKERREGGGGPTKKLEAEGWGGPLKGRNLP